MKTLDMKTLEERTLEDWKTLYYEEKSRRMEAEDERDCAIARAEAAERALSDVQKCLRFAAGLLSTYGSFTDKHPEAVLEYIRYHALAEAPK